MNAATVASTSPRPHAGGRELEVALALITRRIRAHDAQANNPGSSAAVISRAQLRYEEARSIHDAIAALSSGGETQGPLEVWYGSMPESNGRTNWTAMLHRGDLMDGVTLARSEYPHRVRYEADRVRYLLGELPTRPHILDYPGDERTPCHLCGGTGAKDGKRCPGLDFAGTVHVGKQPAAPTAATPLLHADERYRKAVAIVLDAGRASVSMVQRKLNIPYSQAQELVARMVGDGIAGIGDTPGLAHAGGDAASPAGETLHRGQAACEHGEHPAEAVLRDLACWLGVGGYNAPTVDAQVFRKKIVEGVLLFSQLHGIAARRLAEQVLSMDMATDKGLRAKELARQVLGMLPLGKDSSARKNGPLTVLRVSDTHEWRLTRSQWELHDLAGADADTPLRKAERFETELLDAAKREADARQTQVDAEQQPTPTTPSSAAPRCNVTPELSAQEWLCEHDARHRDGGPLNLQACQAANVLRSLLTTSVEPGEPGEPAAEGPTMTQIEELVDAIAGEWDGCSYDEAMVQDIGQAIRQAGRPRIRAMFTTIATTGRAA